MRRPEGEHCEGDRAMGSDVSGLRHAHLCLGPSRSLGCHTCSDGFSVRAVVGAMSLSLLFFLNLLARAFAWARVAATFEAAAGRNASLAEHLEGLEGLQPQPRSPGPRPAFKGGLQLLGACCGEQRQKALEVETSINSNTLYGSTKEIAEVLFNASACAPVPETDRGQKAKAGCAYVAIFANTEFADNEYAANCVPAQVCKDDVLGRTKGLIASYGVLLQTMQENLGSLVYLSEGPISRCYEGRDQINLGNLQSLLVEKELRFDEEGAVLGSEMVMEIPGMESLGSQQSLLPCKDDPSLGYLYVHRNRYWSSEKQAVDLAAFELRQSRSLPKIQRKAQLRAKALKEVSENSAEEPKPKAELQALERIDAVAPEALGVKAPRGSEPKAQTAEKEAEAGAPKSFFASGSVRGIFRRLQGGSSLCKRGFEGGGCRGAEARPARGRGGNAGKPSRHRCQSPSPGGAGAEVPFKLESTLHQPRPLRPARELRRALASCWFLDSSVQPSRVPLLRHLRQAMRERPHLGPLELLVLPLRMQQMPTDIARADVGPLTESLRPGLVRLRRSG